MVATKLAQLLSSVRHHYTYRFLFVPGTIGSIAWLARNEETVPRVKHGFVLAGVGDPGGFTYKRSRRSNLEIDQAFEHVLSLRGDPYSVVDYEPYGYDERQYCSPGFDMPVGNLSRTPYGTYPEYHTSADNPDFVQPASLQESLSTCFAALEILEGNERYVNLQPKGEPQLGKRGLYESLGGVSDAHTAQRAMLWVLSGSDGQSSLLDIARRANLPFPAVEEAANNLLRAKLLAPSSHEAHP